jgi:hypothetical protein
MHTKKAIKYAGMKRRSDLTKHDIQKIQGICPHVSDRPFDQSTQLGHLSHLASPYTAEVKKLQLCPV